MPFRGNWGELDANRGLTTRQIMGTILARGLDHHWSLGYGHWKKELQLLNHWLDVSEITPVADGAAFAGLSA